MPQLTVRGIEPLLLAAYCPPLLEELSLICDCEPDNFTIDLLQTVSICGGVNGASYPFIEVAWFDRGPAARDRFAEAVHRHLRLAGVQELEIAFKVYMPSEYYVNGQPCR